MNINQSNNEITPYNQKTFVPRDLLDIKLEAGDILFLYDDNKTSTTRSAIKAGQAAISILSPNVNYNSTKNVHVGIYDGNGNVIEAIGRGVITTPLNSLNWGDEVNTYYEVVRLKDSEWGHRAGFLAKQCSETKDDSPEITYSARKAVLSLPRITKDISLKTYKKACNIARKGKIFEGSEGSLKSLFCSEFVALMLLSVDADRVYFQAKNEGAEVDRKYVKDHAKFYLNPKAVSPGYLHSYIEKHPELFEKICIISSPSMPPSSTARNTE